MPAARTSRPLRSATSRYIGIHRSYLTNLFKAKVGIIVCANLMFVLFSLPMVTIGASYVALYHVMLKTLRGDGVLNPFKQLFKDFSRFLPIVDDSGDFILDPDGNKIMPGSPEEKAYYETEGIAVASDDKSEEKILEEMK